MTGLLSGPAPAIGLAMLAAVGFAGAAVLQHRAVAAASDPDDVRGETLTLRALRTVTRRPGWLTGLALAGGGTVLHAIALVLAPLSVVQPVGVLAVPIAVLLTALRSGNAPTRGVLVGVTVSVAGVAAFVLTAAGHRREHPGPRRCHRLRRARRRRRSCCCSPRSAWPAPAGCAAWPAPWRGPWRSGWSPHWSGPCPSPSPSGDSPLLDPAVLAAGAGIAAAVVVGGWLVQQAFASGPPEVVVACLTVVDPIVAVLLGVVLLGEGAAAPASTGCCCCSPPRSPPPRGSSRWPGIIRTRPPAPRRPVPGAAPRRRAPTPRRRPAPHPRPSRPPWPGTRPTAGDPSTGRPPHDPT